MKILVTGSKGQVGRELMEKGHGRGNVMTGFDIEELDITNYGEILKTVRRLDIDVVVNAAAYTAVDKAETEAESAYAVNRDGPRNLAKACAKKRIPLVHISTDYVYSGEKQGAYVEDDPMAPAGIYAKSKADGDMEVVRHLAEHIIIRTAWMYSVYGNNFVKTMLRLGHENEIIRVVDDQWGCPTDAADLAVAVLKVAQRIYEKKDRSWGTYHYSGKGATSWYGFAKKIFEISKEYDSFLLKKIQPVPSKDYAAPAKRPANSVLNCGKIETTFGIAAPPWEESLSRMLHRLYIKHA